MKILAQIPYNLSYDDYDLIEYLLLNKSILHSLYFGFSKGSRPWPFKNNNKTFEQHVEKLLKLKMMLNVKLVYLLNSVLPISLDDLDFSIISSGIVDIVTIARDDIFEQVNEFAEKKNIKLSYELSRLYAYVKDNSMITVKFADGAIFGFERELKEFLNSKAYYGISIGFIINERCYESCGLKLVHNTNVMSRNLGLTKEKFICPNIEKTRIFEKEEIIRICNNYKINILKLCDRKMTDIDLKNTFKEWMPFINTLNS